MLESYEKYRARNFFFLGLLFISLILIILISLRAGSYHAPLWEIARALFGKAHDPHINQVILNLRLPRILTALIGGIGLGLSGCVLQAVLRNPLASTSTLGIAQGASFGAALAILFSASTFLISISAFVFSMAVSFFILALSRFRSIGPEAMVLSGVALGAMFQGATALIQFFADELQLASIVFWTFGDLGRTGWQEIRLMAIIVAAASIFFFYSRWDYNALESGQQTAVSLGINLGLLRILNMLVCSLTASVIVSNLGLINFIGLVAPHIVRRFMGNNHTWLLAGSALMGGIILLAGDLLARSLLAPIILPIGAISSFLGAPLFLYLLFKGGDRR